MRKTHTLFALLLVVGTGGGLLYAQEPGDKKPDETPAEDLPEATVNGATEADLSPREMDEESDRMIDEMEAHHVRVLELQGAARKAKDVIKLNCVNESLLAVKQLLNIAEDAEHDLTEAIAGGDRAQQVHDYTQIKLASERSTSERDTAEGCIGEEIVFVGPTQVDVDGPTIPDDPTDDPDDPFVAVGVELERSAYASPFN